MSNVTELPDVHSIPVGRFLTTSGWKALSSGCLFDNHTAMVQTDAEGCGRLLLAVDTEDDPMLSGFEPFAAVWEYAALSSYGRLLYQPPRSISPDEVTTGEVPTTELNRRVTAAFHCYQARTPPVPISAAPAPKTGILGVPPGLKERLYQFEEGIAGQPQAQRGFTIAAVHELAAVLYEKSSGVSATVDSHGMLTLSAAFPEDKRLYVEIEPSGQAGAAVTKERRYARDIPIQTASELTREVIDDSLGSL